MFCPMCGAPNEDEAQFCGNCGAVLEPDEWPDEETAAAVVGLGGEKEEELAEDAPLGDRLTEVVERTSEEATLEPYMPDEPHPAPPTPPPLPPGPRPVRSVQTSGLAIASLVSGIVGWTVLPLIGSVLAIIFGHMARNEIRQSPGELEGDGLAIAGLVLGWIAVGLTVLVVCLGALGMCFFFSVVSTSGY